MFCILVAHVKGQAAQESSQRTRPWYSPGIKDNIRKTIPLCPKLNIGITKTAGGFKSFNAFMASQDATYSEITEMNIFETHVIPDLEDNHDDMCTYMLEMSKIT